MLEVTNIRVRSYDLGYLDVYWDLAPCFEDVLQYEFVVQRSGAEYGEYEDISAPLIDRYHLKDNAVPGRHDKYSKVYYRVLVRDRRTSDTKTFPVDGPGIALGALPDLAAMEMARLERLKLAEFKGRMVWVYKRRAFGQQCTVCYDPVMQRHTSSNCSMCYNTSWVGGYHAPVQTHAQIVTPSEQTVHANIGKVQPQNTYALLGNIPEVFEGDLVVEAENVIWRVATNLSKVKKARALIRQQVPLHQVQQEDIEYTIPLSIDESTRKDLLASPSRNYTNPQTIRSEGLAGMLHGLRSRL